MYDCRYSMECSNDYIELVRQAQLGNKESLDALAERFQGKLYAYVYRIVVDSDVAQDIVQESLLQMLKVINKLERADRFWPWLRAIAFNRIRRAYNEGKSRKARVMARGPEAQRQSGGNEGGLAKLVAEELRDAVLATIKELKPQHRRVLAMRCYEEMEYSEIAELDGCSELGARVRFCRAKRALRRGLSSKGFGKGFLVTALVVFGKLTAPSEAAAASVSVTACTLKAGLAAGLISLVGSKAGIVSLVAAGVLGAGTAVMTDGFSAGRLEEILDDMQAAETVTRAAKGAEESWYYYPLGRDGPVMMRVVRWESEVEESHHQLWQDAEADYFFDRRKNTIYINNWRMLNPGLAVQRLPTDGTELREFISRVEDRGYEMEYVSGDGKGLLVVTKRGGEGSEGAKVVHHRYMMNEEYYRYKWPATATIVDRRDVMHKRGWTYFRISGEIDGRQVRGGGRMPFVYAARKGYYPWLDMEVGKNFRIVDTGAEAVVYEGEEQVAARYAGESFFEGLSRPWMGLHTIDTVRRDAAGKRVWFETELPARQNKAQVTLTCEQVKLVYTIDIEKDVVDKIVFSWKDGAQGELRFSYLEEIGEAAEEFAAPAGTNLGTAPRNRPGGLWLVKLRDENW